MPKFYYAPMCHLSGAAYRQLLRTYHGDIVFVTQMFSAKAIVVNSYYRQELQESFYSTEVSDVFLYLVFSSVQELIEALPIVSNLPIAGVNLNFACPADCAAQRQYGEYFNRDLIRYCCLQACNTSSKPITVKVRLPETPEEDIAFFQYFVGTGVSEIICHARRNRKQNKKAAQDSTDFAALSVAVRCGLYVIANGGIKSRTEGEQLCTQYGFAGYMIGMELARNPRLVAVTALKRQFSVLQEYLDIYDKLENRGVAAGQYAKELMRHCMMLGGSVIRNESMQNMGSIRYIIASQLEEY